ncbi:MAG: type transport system ATP-binding protein [Eubacteriales bacterium]|nr:type transport system ATP-binding protein [Eubacteriales bacterium]MDN5364684.1 type transport system ATP-binding protein [Eubacteriales bacterium]
MTDFAIETWGLTKVFGQVAAVKELDLRVPKGSIYGFLGPNGAGKTTTIKMLLGLLQPTGGGIRVLGLDPKKESLEILMRTGYVAETQNMYGYMTVKEIIDFCKALYPRWEDGTVKKYLDLFELPTGKKVKALSKGMKNQLALALALGSGPDLLILDEPTSGLDPQKIKDFLTVIVEQVAETGQTVFFSSHQLYEVERIADWVGMIVQGRLVFSSSMDDLKARHKKIKVMLAGESLPQELTNRPEIIKIELQGRGYVLTVSGNIDRIIALLNSLNPSLLEVFPETLEEIFLAYTEGVRT